MSTRRRFGALLATAALLAGGVVAAPAASAAPGDRELVSIWYFEFLGRLDDSGSDYWVDRLGEQQPSDVLWSITHSEEYDARTIAGYYEYLFGRELDQGARYWIDGINAQRFPSEWALQNILASPEYVFEKNNAVLINGWYDALLDRQPSAGEFRYWAQRRATIGDLGTVRELYYSPESIRLQIQSAYANLLAREAGASEVAYWYDKQVENSVNVQVLIASSPEYRSSVAERYAFL